ncbi:MAG: hypothetical protein K2P26_05915 [Oscillospiraceae bacterium]|nr:hypothetical protein [Oscillospiraceae bacterium]
MAGLSKQSRHISDGIFKFLAFFVEKPGQNSAYDYPGAIWDAQQKRRISRGAVSGVTSAQLQGAVVVRNRGTHDI